MPSFFFTVDNIFDIWFYCCVVSITVLSAVFLLLPPPLPTQVKNVAFVNIQDEITYAVKNYSWLLYLYCFFFCTKGKRYQDCKYHSWIFNYFFVRIIEQWILEDLGRYGCKNIFISLGLIKIICHFWG